MDTDHIIEVSGLRKSFGATRVLDGIDFTVERSSVFALLGPNGAGKTTTVHILSTLIRPDGGTVRIDGHDVLREAAAVRSTMSLTGQFAAVDDLLTGRENLVMMAKLRQHRGAEVGRAVNAALERFDLVDAADKVVQEYSGGMRRKLDIAMSVVNRPKLLFLDEPTTGLDPHSRREAWTLVRELVDEGTTVFLTTQYLDEADHLADRVAVLDRGRIVAEGSPDDLKQRVGSDRIEVDYEDGSTRSVATDGSLASMRHALGLIEEETRAVAAIRVREASLDDAFLALTGKPAGSETPTNTGASR